MDDQSLFTLSKTSNPDIGLFRFMMNVGDFENPLDFAICLWQTDISTDCPTYKQLCLANVEGHQPLEEINSCYQI